MNVSDLAGLMGVSPRDAADFVEGVRLQMRRGLGLDAAIAAHRDSMQAAFDHMARRSDNAAYGQRMRDFVVDTFYPAQVQA